jgi:hypothetical protein
LRLVLADESPGGFGRREFFLGRQAKVFFEIILHMELVKHHFLLGNPGLVL